MIFSLIPNPLQRVLTYESNGNRIRSTIKTFHRIPAQLTREELQVVRKAAKVSFRAMGLRDLGRMMFASRMAFPT